MPIETIEFNGKSYPAFQAKGNAARWVREFALEICQPTGTEKGCDIGCSVWPLPGAFMVDSSIEGTGHAMDIYKGIEFDYIHSSHCLEHLPHWVEALDYWHSRLKSGGVLFLYLPDRSQEYWFPTSNRKHIHSFTPELLRMYFELSDNGKMWKNIFVSGVDLNNSFIAMSEKI